MSMVLNQPSSGSSWIYRALPSCTMQITVNGSESEEQPVLLSTTWLDAIEMSSLVRSFQVGCQTSAASVTNDKADPS